jgi:hypothetical protein
MLVQVKPGRRWSDIALKGLVVSIIMAAALSIVHGLLRGPMALSHGAGSQLSMFETWASDFRYLFETGMYVGTLLFVGAKFFELRTVFAIGFDTIDAERMTLKGPDENNIVWVGHRYRSALEAETIAAALKERLSVGPQV